MRRQRVWLVCGPGAKENFGAGVRREEKWQCSFCFEAKIDILESTLPRNNPCFSRPYLLCRGARHGASRKKQDYYTDRFGSGSARYFAANGNSAAPLVRVPEWKALARAPPGKARLFRFRRSTAFEGEDRTTHTASHSKPTGGWVGKWYSFLSPR